MKVLVIEDDGQMRQKVVDALFAQSVETVFEASNLHSALDLVRDADAIVSDCGFPIEDGEAPFDLAWMGMRDAACALRKPFLLLTSDGEMCLEALHQNTEAYLKQDASEAIRKVVHWFGQADRHAGGLSLAAAL